MASTIRLFLSHAHQDDDLAFELRRRLRESTYPFAISIVLASGTKIRRSPEELRTDFLAPRIRWSHVMLVLLTDEALLSEWVNWELHYAVERKKLIVAVRARPLTAALLPEVLTTAQIIDSDPPQIWAACQGPHQRSRSSASSRRRPV